MKQLISPLILLFLIIFSVACSEKSVITTEQEDSYSWQVVDSLTIAILGNPIMASVNNQGSLFTFYDFPSSEILVVDAKGSILNRFSKTADTPDNYGFMLDLPVVWGTDRLVQIGMNGIFIFDLKGNLIKKIDHPESIGGAATMRLVGKSSKIVSRNGKEYILMKSNRSRDTHAGEQKFYDTYKALDLVEPESEEMTELGPFESGSKFLDGKGYNQSDYAPAFEVSGDKLYIAHGSEQKMYIYDFSDDNTSLDTTISLDVPGFFEVGGKERKKFSEGGFSVNMSTAAIRNIHLVNDKVIIHYFPGIDPKIMDEARALYNEGKEEEGNNLYKKALEQSIPGVLIYDRSTLDYLGNMIFPSGTTTGGFVADDKFLYFQRAPASDLEEDFLRVYKIKLEEE